MTFNPKLAIVASIVLIAMPTIGCGCAVSPSNRPRLTRFLDKVDREGEMPQDPGRVRMLMSAEGIHLPLPPDDWRELLRMSLQHDVASRIALQLICPRDEANLMEMYRAYRGKTDIFTMQRLSLLWIENLTDRQVAAEIAIEVTIASRREQWPPGIALKGLQPFDTAKLDLLPKIWNVPIAVLADDDTTISWCEETLRRRVFWQFDLHNGRWTLPVEGNVRE